MRIPDTSSLIVVAVLTITTFAWLAVQAGNDDSNSDTNGGRVELQQIAAGIHVFVGPHGEASAENLGSFANVAVIVGEQAVAVVDTGGSQRFGERFLASIRRITSLPISHVFNTHVHPDHVLGNGAFNAPGTQFVGHQKLPRAMAQRASFYMDNFSRLVGEGFAGTQVVPADITVDKRLDIDLGGRRITAVAYPTAHTDNDLSVFDHKTGTLFSGDLLFMERLPVVDGSLKGWLEVMKMMTGSDAMPVQRVVPGHGPASAPWPSALADQQRYLEILLRDTRAAVARGDGIQAAIKVVAPKEKLHWLLHEDNHPRNVTTSYAELEWE